jgi:hypothetical protein
LLRQYQQGATIEQLAAETGIPPERIEMRIRAAKQFDQTLLAIDLYAGMMARELLRRAFQRLPLPLLVLGEESLMASGLSLLLHSYRPNQRAVEESKSGLF